MTLPADIARCPGYEAAGEWREGCEDCFRRTEPAHERQVWMEPPPIIAFECEYRIVLDNWWEINLARHEAAGMLDAERGVFEPPHADGDDPQDCDENSAYRRGFDKRRKSLGSAFAWAD